MLYFDSGTVAITTTRKGESGMSTTLELEPSVGERSVKSTENKRPKSKPWQRQRGEPVASFRLFLVYLELGEKRSLRQVSELDGSPCLRIIERKSRRWNWKARAEATDARLARKAARSLLRRLYRERLELFAMRSRAMVRISSATVATLKSLDISRAGKQRSVLKTINRQLDGLKKSLVLMNRIGAEADAAHREIEKIASENDRKFRN